MPFLLMVIRVDNSSAATIMPFTNIYLFNEHCFKAMDV